MKILIVGLGSIGQRHARNLRSLCGNDLELLAYRVRGLNLVITPELTIKAGADIETEYGIRTYPTLDAALAENPLAVLVTNPNSLHIPVALAAARAGCNLFIEKPLSHSMDGVDELLELVETKKLVCLVGYQLRFHPGFKLVKSLLNRGVIGTPLAARLEFGEYLPGWHRYEDYRLYHASRKDQGGGVILSQIHDLDYAYALFGMPVRVFALGGKLSSLETDVEDIVSMLMEFRVAGKPMPVHIHQDYVQRPPSRNCEIIGDAGKIVWDYYANEVRVTRAETGTSEVHRFDGFQRNQLFIDEMKHFLNCLAGKETPVVGLREGMDSLKIALAAKRSLETGQVVELT